MESNDLSLDNCAAYLTELMLQHIRLIFFSANTIKVILLFDEGIIKVFYSHYRKKLTKKAVTGIGVHNLSMSSKKPTAKFISLLDAMYYVKISLDSEKTNMIKNYFLLTLKKKE